MSLFKFRIETSSISPLIFTNIHDSYLFSVYSPGGCLGWDSCEILSLAPETRAPGVGCMIGLCLPQLYSHWGLKEEYI